MLLELRLPVAGLFHFRAASTLLMLPLHCLWGNNKIKWQQQQRHHQQQRGVKLFQLTHTAIVSICQALISISAPIRVIRIGQCVGSNHQPSLLCGRSPHSPITPATTTSAVTTATRATPCHVLTTLNFHFMRSLCN